jgi:hypothetical protein
MIGGRIVINYQSPEPSLKNLSLLRVIKTEKPCFAIGAKQGFSKLQILAEKQKPIR